MEDFGELCRVSEELIRELEEVYLEKVREDEELCGEIRRIEKEVKEVERFARFYWFSMERCKEEMVKEIEKKAQEVKRMQFEILRYEEYIENNTIKRLHEETRNSKRHMLCEIRKK